MFALALLISMTGQEKVVPSLVYLECDIQQGSKVDKWQITLNEAQGTVDYDMEISGPQRRKARFTADAVYFIGFTLSRIDLSIERNEGAGQCRLAEMKDRAF